MTKSSTVPPHLSLAITRRRLLQAMPVLAFAPNLAGQDSQTPIAVVKLHSLLMRVADVQHSLGFYQALFAAPVQARQGDTVCLRIGDGPGYFALAPLRPGERPGIAHIGLAVADFDADELMARLDAHGISRAATPLAGQDPLSVALRYWVEERQHTAGDNGNVSRDLYFADAEGIVYHLCAEDHCGGRGDTGNVCDAPEAVSAAGMFQLTGLSHFTNFMAGRGRANEFITTLFGKQYQAWQGPAAPVIGVGDGVQFLMYTGAEDTTPPSRPGVIHHVCFGVRDFDVERILERLTDYGLTARQDPADSAAMMHWISMRMPDRGGATAGTPELYFTDPDGIRIQLQHSAYCGGGGYLGDDCPAID